ncbi:phage tail tube protein [Sinomonas sp. JGH33]|uniref:Phage tail tube protein n=1 Tax=Sinomonas terricola TaxID=3110330 RepID=A0ABU5T474_9MICC|nr:phage tail tube protein [Sinomonas sp. JGH33]MEA5454473.1 phage tail tube protein [Sinomonas sp. JGH33]
MTSQDTSVGIGRESVYGTGVTPTAFLEYLTETFDWKPEFKQGQGLRVGSRFGRANRRVLVKQSAEGDLECELVTKGLGKLFEAWLGSGVSTAVPGQTGVFQQLYTPAAQDVATSYTIQKGLQFIGGSAAQPETFRGGVCTSGELTAALGDIVKLKTSWNFRDVDTATAYAAPSYASGAELLSFVHGAITVGGTVTMPTSTALATGGTTPAAIIRDFSFSLDSKIDDGGFGFGFGGKRGRKPVFGAVAEGKGKLTVEYSDNVLRDAYLNQSDLALTLTFKTSTVIGTSANPTVQVVLPDIRLNGEIPKTNGGAPVNQSVDFDILDGLVAGSQIYIAVVTTDTAI